MSSSFQVGCLCVLAFATAGIGHTLWLKSPRFARLAIPLDGGRKLGGLPIFGANKTWAGFLVMPPATALTFGAVGLLATSYDWQALATAGWPRSVPVLMGLGFASGLAYMLGELPNSFVKRRLGIAPGSRGTRAVGAIFQIVDQLDSIVAALLCITLLVPFDVVAWVTALGLGLGVHASFNVLLWKLRIKEAPR